MVSIDEQKEEERRGNCKTPIAPFGTIWFYLVGGALTHFLIPFFAHLKGPPGAISKNPYLQSLFDSNSGFASAKPGRVRSDIIGHSHGRS